ncbi:Smad nuclear-interacting protein 1 [Pichia californica]|uniref:Smad nuclear-interacting protein 1 n=1 Tax=Pichia californica TaxID=460514 RepID=A0A9P6WLW4_9ASCO|nr:Smad nuclear-interacting protein 1 [[Candida] californica]KAG0688453.1 Smad nuclear-interacting protein 1 [[Candida] californica]
MFSYENIRNKGNYNRDRRTGNNDRADYYRDNKVRKSYRNQYNNSNYNTRLSNKFDNNHPTPIPIDLRPSGILTKYISNENIIKSKYIPPDDEIIPTFENCNIHLFKFNEETNKQIEIPIFNFKSYFIFGRDNEISDIIISDNEDGDLVSKQHAVLQFRLKNDEKVVKCYLIDLGSTNGTFLNDDKTELPSKRFIELKNNDVFKLGDSESIIEFMIVENK